MANTLVLLEKVTVGAAGAASITFSNIPQTGYNDLVIKVSARDTTTGYYSSANIPWQVQFNGLTTNLSSRNLFSTGSAVSSNTYASNIYGSNSTGLDTASTFSNGEVYIPNYTSSNYKSTSIDAVAENNATAAGSQLNAGLWSSTAAITSIKLLTYTTFAQYSTFSLYGVSNVDTTPLVAPKATGGDIIQTDGTYWYHAFINSGTFTPAVGLTCDYLVVAGGGGASRLCGAGAGGLRSTVTTTGGGGTLESAISISTAQTVTIGAGGAGCVQTGGNTALRGQNGSNSVFGSITSTGGGGGADGNSAGFSGGSGGGAWNPGAGGAGTTGQGYAGGSATTYGGGVPYGQGGGGGAGQAGQAAQSGNIAGTGGNGVQITALATPTTTGADSGYYAGGGGGSSDSSVSTKAGGLGGGGAGGGLNAGTVNTGGGGGAQGGVSGLGGAGGSGIVIIRYAI